MKLSGTISVKVKNNQALAKFSSLENVKNLKSKSSIDHPIEQYKIIRRFLTFWTSLQSEMEEYLDFERFEPYPNRDDLVGAAEGIFRIQDVYALDSFDLAEGMELGVKDKEPSDLTVEETLSIGKIAYWKVKKPCSSSSSIDSRAIIIILRSGSWQLGNKIRSRTTLIWLFKSSITSQFPSPNLAIFSKRWKSQLF